MDASIIFKTAAAYIVAYIVASLFLNFAVGRKLNDAASVINHRTLVKTVVAILLIGWASMHFSFASIALCIVVFHILIGAIGHVAISRQGQGEYNLKIGRIAFDAIIQILIANFFVQILAQ